MATYLALNLLMLTLVYLVIRPKSLLSKAHVATFGLVLLLTFVFDNLMIAVGLFSYTDAKILGIVLGKAPVEDFFYAVLAVMIVPALWQRFAKKTPEKGPKQ